MRRVVLICADQGLNDRVQQALSSRLEVVVLAPASGDLLRELARLAPALVLVAPCTGGVSVQQAVEAAAAVDRRLEVVALGDAANANEVIGALRAGASDFIGRDEPPEALLAQVEAKLRDQAPEAPSGPAAGGFHVVVAPQPGTASGLFALDLALMRAQAACEALLIDCALPATIAAPALDLAPTYGLWDAARDAERMDRTLFDAAAARHVASGLRVLPLALRGSEEPQLSSEAFVSAVRAVRPLFHETVLYLAGLRGARVSATLLKAATRIFLVCPQAFTAVRDARDLLAAAGEDIDLAERVTLVIEDYSEAIDLGEEHMRQTLGLTAAVRLPPAREALLNGLNLGRPYILEKPQSPYAAAVRQAAGLDAPRGGADIRWEGLRERLVSALGGRR